MLLIQNRRSFEAEILGFHAFDKSNVTNIIYIFHYQNDKLIHFYFQSKCMFKTPRPNKIIQDFKFFDKIKSYVLEVWLGFTTYSE